MHEKYQKLLEFCRTLPPTFVANVPTDEVKKQLASNFIDTEIFNNTYTPIVVNTGKNLVVIDTGFGEAGIETTKGSAGNFLNNLAAAGIDPKNVDTVIISHFHGDHVNGLVRKDASVAFPNAAIKVPAQKTPMARPNACRVVTRCRNQPVVGITTATTSITIGYAMAARTLARLSCSFRKYVAILSSMLPRLPVASLALTSET